MAGKFRLEAVLEIRRKKAEAQELELAEASRRVAAQLSVITALKTDIASTQAMLNSHQHGHRINVTALLAAQQYLETLEHRLAAEKTTLADLQRLELKKRDELVEAHKDQKAIEKLKERASEREIQAARYVEQRTAEEIATIGYIFGQR